MLKIVEAIYSMVGNIIDLPKDEDTPEKRVTKIFKQMDKNKDGKLTMEEFREGSKCDPWIVQALAIDLPQEDPSQADEDWTTNQFLRKCDLHLHVHVASSS